MASLGRLEVRSYTKQDAENTRNNQIQVAQEVIAHFAARMKARRCPSPLRRHTALTGQGRDRAFPEGDTPDLGSQRDSMAATSLGAGQG